ncbi:MAG TPA: hypothetical protein DD619_05815, partial [Alphaproteobacteria bacterium]|nr:hypothetical protein [Alphaproteobacteria bacterium]
MFVDGRYELQARQEVDLNKITVINEEPTFVNVCSFLQEAGAEVVGYDGMSVSLAEEKAVEELFESLNLMDFGDLTDLDCKTPVKVLERPLKYAGKSREEKLKAITALLKEYGADYYLLTAADSVSWLLNIYAEDLPCSPVVRAYALIDKKGKATLIGDNLQTDLPVWTFDHLSEWLDNNNAEILYDESITPEGLVRWLENGYDVCDICQMLKAEKNETELNGMIACHQRDGVALTKLLYWLQNNWQGKTELDVVQKLHELRQEQDLFFEESFETIAGAAENGAIVHYQPT